MEAECFSFRHRDAKLDFQEFDVVAKAKALALHIASRRDFEF